MSERDEKKTADEIAIKDAAYDFAEHNKGHFTKIDAFKIGARWGCSHKEKEMNAKVAGLVDALDRISKHCDDDARGVKDGCILAGKIAREALFNLQKEGSR